MFDCNDNYTSESDESLPSSPIYDRYQSGYRHVVPTAVLTQSKLVPIADVRPVTTAVPKTSVTRPRQAKTFITKPNSPPRRHINHNPSLKASNFPPKVTAVKAPMVNAAKIQVSNGLGPKEKLTILFLVQGNPQHALKDKGVIDSGCSRHITCNMSYLSDFEELNGGYVAFDGNLKGGKISGKDSLLPIPFWAEAVNTACYVQNRVLVTKPHNKNLYELLHGRTPSIGFMRPFGCPLTILNTLDSLDKFDGKVDEIFLVRYSVSSKAFRVFNSRTQIVQETLHINVLENKPNVAGSGPTWLFDIDTLTKTLNYQPVTIGNQSNPSAGVQEQFNAEKAEEESEQQYGLFPVWSSGSINPHNTDEDAAFDKKEPEFEGRKPESKSMFLQLVVLSQRSMMTIPRESINEDNVAGTLVPAIGQFSPNSTNTFSVADITYSDDEDNVGAEADFNNMETSITVSPILTTRIHKDHHVTQIIGDLSLATQTRSMTGVAKDQGFDDPTQPDKVYKVVKALYELHQAPRAWYETLANYLLENGFQRGKIDQTLFIKRQKGDILLVQIYVNDIIFDSTNKYLCKDFEKLMKDKFQMSSMGELTFFLGLQVKQKKDAIFISQDKYVAEILRKFGLTDGKSASTLIDTEKPLLKDPDGKDILQGQATVRLVVSQRFTLDLVAYSDSDYAGASLDRKSTTRGCQFIRFRLIFWQCKKQTVVGTSSTEAELRMQVATSSMESLKRMLHVTNILSAGSLTTPQMVLNSSCLTYINNWLVLIKRSLKVNEVTRLQALVDKKKVIITEATIRDALRLDNAEGVECLPNEEIFADLVRNVDSSTKFYMYPRFLQLMIRAQVGDLSSHTTKYSSPALTKKVFANMRRVGKGFSRVETPLFEGMIVAHEVGKGAADVNVEDIAVDEPSIPSPTPPTPPPQSSQYQPSTSQV
uniref:Reverse transcriptase Ty1/copia-type domain-containing protein n=1 Tax=Tanacetum cinerariifolium TaxID=118510 RepID=A0A6L2L5A9_TANCI|nr:hypothetical protein [Tanacetum cinerariifolium]